MKKKIPFLLIALAILAFTSCKKADDGNAVDNSSQFAAQSDDQQQVSNEIDNVANDANNSLDSHPSMNGRVENRICDGTVTVNDSTGSGRTVTIIYNGTSCDGRRQRKGTVTLLLPAGKHWKDAGAVLTINADLTITRKRDSKSVEIKGTVLVTNVSGGLVKDLSSLGTITHTITSDNMSIAFGNGTSRNWQISKQRVFTYVNGVVITTTGTHTDGSNTNISEWGTNRFGTAFTTSITEPMVISQDCDYRVTSGQLTHDRNSKSFVVTFGLDANGSPTACPGAGNYYYEVHWTNAKGKSMQVIAPY